MTRFSMLLWAVLAAISSTAVLDSAQGSFTLDRDYRLGDDPNENAAAGIAVGSGSGADGFTFDGAGLPAMMQFVDLVANNGPTYASVAGRPLGGTGLGAAFDGVDDFLLGERLGLPATSFSATGGVTAGTLDYEGITNRGFQFWVRPDGAGQGRLQSLVNDTNQHGVAISSANTWVMRYGGVAVDSAVAVPFDAWSHVMLVRPSGAAGGSRLYIDGVAVAARGGGYNGANEFPLILGANTGNPLGDPGQFPGTSEHFDGTIDDLEMFVMGTSTVTFTDYGTFDFATDNEFAAAALSTYVPGDATGDGLVQGDGSGGADDDVAVFVAQWRQRNLVNGLAVGDLGSPARADFNFDGLTNLLDWDLLVASHPNGSSLNLGALLSVSVPEPASGALATLVATIYSLRRRKPRGPGRPGVCQRTLGLQSVALVATLAAACTAPLARGQVSFVGVVPNTGGDVRAAATLTGPNAGLTYDGSFFFNASSTGQDSNVNDPTAGNPFGDLDLRNNLPSYISAGPGADYVGVSGGWGYQQIVDDFGAAFESGVGTIPAATSGTIIDLTIGSGAPSTLLIGLLSDNLDGPAFVPGSFTVRKGSSTATAIAQTPNLNSDLYYFVVDGVAPNDVIHIDLGAAASITTLAGLQVGNGASFTPLFDPDPILTVNRTTGALTLTNNTAGPIDFRAYEIESLGGALNPAAWSSITDNYDADSGGSIDPSSNWLEFTAPGDRDNLAEGQQPGGGVALAQGAVVNLGTAWLQCPTEDVSMRLLQTDGSLRSVQVIYTGNDGARLPFGDLNADGSVNLADWNLFKPLINQNVMGLSAVELYRNGDFNGDESVDFADARAFAIAFDAANGNGAFAAAMASVPEPTHLCLMLAAGLTVAFRRRRCGAALESRSSLCRA